MNKKFRFLLASAMLLSFGFTAGAQDVDGISLWDKCTKEQLIKKYGQPVKYYSQEDNEVLPGLLEIIDFKDSSITLDGNYVTEFRINTSKPRAMTKYISEGIRIGDSEDSLKKYEKYLFERTVLKDGRILYDYYILLDNRFHIITKDGKIINIYAEATTT